VQKVLPVAQV